jgi:hypothetical protein
MTNANNSSDDIREIIAEIARKQDRTQDQILNTQEQLLSNEYLIRDLTNDVTRVLGHNAIVGDMVLEIRENTEVLQRNFEVHQQNFETHQQNFELHQENFRENQRTTNAALERLEAILLQLIQRNN